MPFTGYRSISAMMHGHDCHVLVLWLAKMIPKPVSKGLQLQHNLPGHVPKVLAHYAGADETMHACSPVRRSCSQGYDTRLEGGPGHRLFTFNYFPPQHYSTGARWGSRLPPLVDVGQYLYLKKHFLRYSNAGCSSADMVFPSPGIVDSPYNRPLSMCRLQNERTGPRQLNFVQARPSAWWCHGTLMLHGTSAYNHLYILIAARSDEGFSCANPQFALLTHPITFRVI
jgi:hypothetical protein